MGNCVRKQSKMQWGGDDWGSFGTSNCKEVEHEQSRLLGEENVKPGTTMQVKIKITKDELQNLLKRSEFEGLSVQQVLAELMVAGDGFVAHHTKSWTPGLHSIAE